MIKSMRVAAMAALVVVAAWAGLAVVRSQQVPPDKPAAQTAGRFEFEVIESFDAKYEGDTPGHIGRHGELGDRSPRVALGDAVYRGEKQVGTITGLRWNRGFGSLEVEFDPVPGTRLEVGEIVWLKLGDAK